MTPKDRDGVLRPARELIHQGGLFRCCVGSLVEFLDENKTDTKHNCRYCKAPMVLREDGWHWDHP